LKHEGHEEHEERINDRINPAEARRRRGKMKDNEIGEIKGNTSLKN